MARLVESVVPEYRERVHWEKVVTKDLAGAKRYLALSKELGRPAPVPSIYIDGELTFETTPESETLKKILNKLLSS